MAALSISNQLSSNSLSPYRKASSIASTSVRSLLLPEEDTDTEDEQEEQKIGLGGKKERRTRIAMLCCACCLSLGSHYSSHLLGPLKGSIKSESNFSSLVSSFQLVNTITPLVSGYLIPRIGLGKSAIAATGIVLLGLCVVCYEERNGLEGAIGGVVVGLAIFGMGTSPLAVVQESIILRTNSSSSKSVARSVAAGLLLGKAASFLASAVAEPLSRISPRLPFASAVALSLFSFFMALVYIGLERLLPPEEFRDETTIEGRADESHETKPRVLSMREICSLGDPFFLYILVCFLAAIHYVTIHSGASLLRVFYDETKARSASAASALLFAAIILYPTLGFTLDRKPTVLPWLFGSVVVLLIIYYCILLFATSIVPMFLAVIPAALAIGSGPLLLVVVVPRLVERHQLSTALGIHKSLEMAGSVILQAATSAILAKAESPLAGARSVSILLIISALAQLLAIIVWWWVIASRRSISITGARSRTMSVNSDVRSSSINRGETEALLSESRQKVTINSRSRGETTRGVFAVIVGISCIILSWVVFFLNLGREE